MHGNELIRIQVAQITIAVRSSQPRENIQFSAPFQHFISESPLDVTIHTSFGRVPDLNIPSDSRIFNAADSWALFQTGSKMVLLLGASSFGAGLDGLAAFDSKFKDVQLFRNNEALPDGSLPDPLQHPLGEVLMVCMLGAQRGLMVHACGVDHNGRGYLFAGNSTHGKTTLARLWKNRARILNDDRIILRKRDGQVWMFGTPWHGEFDGVSAAGVPLEKIFVLSHASSNAANQIYGVKAISMLLSRSFPPLWDNEGMEYTLGFLEFLTESVPIYVLDFVPDDSIIEYIQCVN